VATIEAIGAREILDSRGNPTVEVEVVLDDVRERTGEEREQGCERQLQLEPRLAAADCQPSEQTPALGLVGRTRGHVRRVTVPFLNQT
jgi:hypothetical protein